MASTVSDISANVLERGVVPAHDVPNFIANTVGVYALMVIVQAADEFELAFDEVDAITGPAMGRPVSATFRTLDVVGIDVFTAVADNSHEAAEDESERRILAVPDYMREMVARGWTGPEGRTGLLPPRRDRTRPRDTGDRSRDPRARAAVGLPASSG